MKEERADQILEEINKLIEKIEKIKKFAMNDEWCLEYQAECEIEEIEKTMLIINYYKGV